LLGCPPVSGRTCLLGCPPVSGRTCLFGCPPVSGRTCLVEFVGYFVCDEGIRRDNRLVIYIIQTSCVLLCNQACAGHWLVVSDVLELVAASHWSSSQTKNKESESVTPGFF